jgi:amidase
MSSLADQTRWLDATAQAELVRRGDVSPAELTQAAIERIEAIDRQLNAVVLRWFERAAGWAGGALPEGPFRGVPFLLKDLYAPMKGLPMTNGNRAMGDSGWLAPGDSTLVSRYRQAGLVTLGRTNSPELGSVPTTEPVHFGPTHNPWAPDRSPGGSSGGAAAAVASGMVPIAHASDGGGSIRIPASACGLVGLKPSQGRITMGPYVDESGLGVQHCLSRTVRDTAALLDATCGPGIGDTVTAAPPIRPYVLEVGADPGRLRIGILNEPTQGARQLDPQCVLAVDNAAVLLASLGHRLEPAHPAALDDANLTPQFMAMWATNMAVGCQRISEAIGRQVTADDIEPMNWAQALMANGRSAVDYANALAAVSQFRRRIQRWWAPTDQGGEGFDLLLTPTLAGLPPLLGTMVNRAGENPLTPVAMAGQLVPFTPAANTTGQPAISLPLHWTPDGIPVGIHLVAAYGREDILVRVAAQLEAASPWAQRRPTV